ncbi:MAG: MurR/RpiR family transcriptional regulator [Acidobacteria bacterium]|nr:MurR/RpiR family transcriptional regulator [Acidobacteriota bacterium]MCA1651209.1 MurR/RpiR family transcriptional regulator [Acidobacteriota bacterium]
MTTESSLESRLVSRERHLNKRRRRLVQIILESADQTFHLSSRALAERLRVDPATIIRTAQALGYSRFADFAADLREHFVGRISPYTVMQAHAREGRSPTDHVRQSLEEDVERVRTLRSSLQIGQVLSLARQIHRSRRLVVVGVDLAASLSWFLAYALRALGSDAEAPVGSAGSLLHGVRFLTKRDLVIAISFRKCLRETVDAVLRARARGVATFGITDGATTPLARYCDRYITVSIESSSISGSYVAPMAALNAIIAAYAHLAPKRSLAALRQTHREYTTGPRWFEEPDENDKPVPSTGARRQK